LSDFTFFINIFVVKPVKLFQDKTSKHFFISFHPNPLKNELKNQGYLLKKDEMGTE